MKALQFWNAVAGQRRLVGANTACPRHGIASVLGLTISACVDSRSHAHAVYMLVDISGSYVREASKAQRIVNYLLGTLQPGDSLAVARLDSRSFSEKDIIAKATFDGQPSQANAQKRAFRDKLDASLKTVRGSGYSGGTRTVIVFSDMREELDKATIRDIPINLNNIRVVAINVVKLKTDNIDPRRYLGRLEAWQKRVEAAGAAEWRVINDLERIESVLSRGS